ncbi:MAG: 1-(5-phosphoribosyl)-5-[(5-phosphoribosylamino)methylideneamino] imidazole-4-carboxamide isomerase [Marinovum algicola]|jgi:phosphoribosylformimino-5-aminoimidazole carboxamide ribotide isomerase|uniref:1-(5-phosphoribosyl)-5-[(5-phosphoribosylamino)methylideneamino] imidazole-4-carboxamide isomerase n=1 Tax=Marinovum algicola TaxID=42444 RepID=A0A975W6X5_9RHOB|nr:MULTISPECIES: 1-(5-phosphoribosyl)-5-[(5-phosphoribosylamino)methylideneamino] imidazole-4-carboxamide isomerase [Marinovum]AKO96030.1 Phosphoribosylformimino-5-aminoimidazole carboxamide ribonucleotide (ProFAR) isomerase [Marinovum algicola DG 898]MDD9739691.1 1-(5-phosphoribosyl)-5-[(5-phosphoribosylamino)methylideneamino] imidazole-4-carboxamide isomerase [Marinovum sp. SP66]MDD9742799.1 1-(5-phosphoribosyl)-5-[(5-phosphoribosylamino)methylideneamino] imidazole-4-carboxamide isomerase [Mar
MQLIPTIELQNGHPVSLYRGRLEEPQIWHVDPCDCVRRFAHAGAEWIHVTDFDAVAGGAPQDALLQALIRAAEAPLQVGGGVRSRERIEHLLDMGVGRVVIGTAALNQPDLVKAAAKYHPDQIVLAVDVYQGRVMTHGWRETSAFTPEDFIDYFKDDPLAAIMVTDIDSDLSDAEASLALVTDLAAHSRHPVIASGLVRTLDDLARLKYVRNVSGAVVGRALFNKSVDLGEALKLAARPIEEVAEFL